MVPGSTDHWDRLPAYSWRPKLDMSYTCRYNNILSVFEQGNEIDSLSTHVIYLCKQFGPRLGPTECLTYSLPTHVVYLCKQFGPRLGLKNVSPDLDLLN